MSRSSEQRLIMPADAQNSTNAEDNHGILEATILTAYDLPHSEDPSRISIKIGGIIQESGPPMRKNRGRNSYRFSTNAMTQSDDTSEDNSSIRISAPLPEFFKSNLQVNVIYKNKPAKTLVGEYDLNQLRVLERKWVILTLFDPSKPRPSDAIITTIDENESPNSTPNRQSSRRNGEAPPPTFRMALHLEAPYRPEIASLFAYSKTWFAMVDKLQGHLEELWGKLPKLPFDAVYLALPAVPILAMLVVASPILAGILIAGLPFLLPLLVAIMASFFSVILGIAFVCGSSKAGRAFLSELLEPVTEPLFHSRSGQSLLYEIGPRPTPVHLARLLLPSGVWSTLVVSLVIDFIGSASYLLPLVGEAFDLLWAPLQTILVIALYESEDWGYPSLKYISVFEEILPFTDIVPTATIGWSLLYLVPLVFGKDNDAAANGHAIVKRMDTGESCISTDSVEVRWA